MKLFILTDSAPPCLSILLNGESVDRVCAGDGVWSARALPGAPADSVSFAFIMDLSSYSKLLFPHDAVAAVEDALIGLFADDEASSTDPLRAFVFLIRVEAHRDPVGLLAATPDVFVWCHPSIAGHDGGDAAAVYVTNAVAMIAINVDYNYVDGHDCVCVFCAQGLSSAR